MKAGKRFLKEELIGLTIRIIDSKNKTLIGKEGKIVNETKNTITIRRKNKEKMLLKNQIKFVIKNSTNKEVIDGSLLKYKPEHRIKRC